MSDITHWLALVREVLYDVLPDAESEESIMCTGLGCHPTQRCCTLLCKITVWPCLSQGSQSFSCILLQTRHPASPICKLGSAATAVLRLLGSLGRDSWCGTPAVGRNKRPSLESDAIRSYKRLVKHSGQL
jgi:hypothetical protein